VFDIETARSAREDEEERVHDSANRDIHLFQATQRRGEGIALPWRDEFIEVACAIMATPNTKVGHNSWTFDAPVLEANGVVINGAHDDTMVAYGAFWSDLPRNLQSCAQMAGFPMSWKHLSDDDLSLYGCIDVDATLAVYEYVRKMLQETEVEVK